MCPSLLQIRLTLAIVYAFLFGSLYWQQGNVDALAKANGGVLEFSTVSNILGNPPSTLPAFCLPRLLH